MKQVCDKFGTVHDLGNMCYTIDHNGWLIIFEDSEDEPLMIFQEFSWMKI